VKENFLCRSVFKVSEVRWSPQCCQEVVDIGEPHGHDWVLPYWHDDVLPYERARMFSYGLTVASHVWCNRAILAFCLMDILACCHVGMLAYCHMDMLGCLHLGMLALYHMDMSACSHMGTLALCHMDMLVYGNISMPAAGFSVWACDVSASWKLLPVFREIQKLKLKSNQFCMWIIHFHDDGWRK
jgi:uncharacterized membrane protein YpjA